MTEAILSVRNIYLKNRNLFLILLRILVSAVLLTYILKIFNIKNAISLFSKADKLLIFSALGLTFINIFLQYLKWKLVCTSLLEEKNQKKIIQSLFYGFAAGSLSPARVGEYFGRAVSFTHKPILQVTFGVLIDKLFGLFIVLILGSASFLLYLDFSLPFTIVTLIMSFLILYLAYSQIKSSAHLKMILSRYKWIRFYRDQLLFLKNMNSHFKVKLTFLSILFYCCFIIQFALLISAFSHQYDFLNYVWVGNLVMFAKTVIPPVSFGELGIREGASVYFLKNLGGNAAAGFNASVSLFLINVLLPALIGLLFLLRRE